MPEHVETGITPIIKHTFINFPMPAEEDAWKQPRHRCCSEPPTLLPRGFVRDRSVSMDSKGSSNRSKGSSRDLSTPPRHVRSQRSSERSTPQESPRVSFIATPSESEGEICAQQQGCERKSLWKRASARLLLASGAHAAPRGSVGKAVTRSSKGDKSSSSHAPQPRNFTQFNSDLSVKPGDFLESIAPVTMREFEAFESKIVVDLHLGAQFYVLAVGTVARRVQVSTGPYVGWISVKTKHDEPLVVLKSKAEDGEFEAGGVHAVKSPLCMRSEEDLNSQILNEISEGSFIEIIMLGSNNHRRAKVQSPQGIGWISLVTKNGIWLVGKKEYNTRSGSCSNWCDNSSTTTVLDAARAGNLELVKSLCESLPKPNINASDSAGMTALMFAIDYGHQPIIDYLLADPDCDVNCADHLQKLALHHAAGVSPVSFMTPSMHTAVIQALLEARAFPDAEDNMGRTALMLAAAGGCESSVEELLTAGAEITKTDCCGATAVEYARMFDHHKVLTLLEPRLASIPVQATQAPSNSKFSEEMSNVSPECTPEDGPPAGAPQLMPVSMQTFSHGPPETQHPSHSLLLATCPPKSEESRKLETEPNDAPVTKSSSGRSKGKASAKNVLNPLFTQQVADVMAKLEITLLASAGHANVQVRLQKDGGGYNVTVSIKAGEEHLWDLLRLKAQEGLLNAAEQSTVVYVLGYQGQAFEPVPHGFQATLGEMRDEAKACWDYFALGGCAQGCACRWQHPAATATITVVAKLVT